MGKAVIVGGGDRCRIDVPEGSLVIAADRGLRYCTEQGIVPDMVIGDFDSLGYVPDGDNVVVVPCEKDDTDTMLAVKKAVSVGCDELIIYGGMGGRLSHTIANIQTLVYARSQGADAVLAGDDCTVRLCSEGTYVHEGYFSLFALSDTADVEITGARYSGRFTLERTFPLGVSNRADGAFGIKVICGDVLMIMDK